MPSYTGIRNPQGRLHPPYPRPTGEISEGLPIWDFSVFLIHYKGIKFSECVQKQKNYVNKKKRLIFFKTLIFFTM